MFLAAASREVERTAPPALAPSTRAILRRHRWPGNVRELRNAIGRAVVLCLGDVVLPEHLPPSLLKAVEGGTGQAPLPASTVVPVSAPAASSGVGPLQSEIDALEKAQILDALDRCGGNQSRAARMLGISRGKLIARLDSFGITRPRKNGGAPEA